MLIVGLNLGCTSRGYYRTSEPYTPSQSLQAQERMNQSAPQENWVEKKNRLEAVEAEKRAVIQNEAWDKRQAAYERDQKEQHEAYEESLAASERQYEADAKKNEAILKAYAAKRKAMTPAQRAKEDRDGAAAMNRLQAWDAENSARWQAQDQARNQQRWRDDEVRRRNQSERNLFCHRNFGRSC
jgi:hypothetical protein